MTRIEGVRNPPLVAKLIGRFAPRAITRLTGRDPQNNTVIESLMIWAYRPRLMIAMARYSRAVRKPGSLEQRTRNLIQLKAGQMIGCEFTVDMGSQICRHSGFTDAELIQLSDHHASALFTEPEKAALDYTVAVMRTPVEMTDATFARTQHFFSSEQLVQLTALLTLVNVERFYAAFGIGSAGFCDGKACAIPDRPES